MLLGQSIAKGLLIALSAAPATEQHRDAVINGIAASTGQATDLLVSRAFKLERPMTNRTGKKSLQRICEESVTHTATRTNARQPKAAVFQENGHCTTDRLKNFLALTKLSCLR